MEPLEIMVIILAVMVAVAAALIALACCKMAGDCAREEEKKENDTAGTYPQNQDPHRGAQQEGASGGFDNGITGKGN